MYQIAGGCRQHIRCSGITLIIPGKNDGSVKSLDAALRQAQGGLSAIRGELVEPSEQAVSVMVSPLNHAHLACGAFYKAIEFGLFLYFYEFIKNDQVAKCR